MKLIFSKEVWTSDLSILADRDVDITVVVERNIKFIEDNIELVNGKVISISKELELLIYKYVNPINVKSFILWKGDGSKDYTGIMKGVFIELLYTELSYLDNVIINHGGDIKYKLDHYESISVSKLDKFTWRVTGTGSICYSSNNKRDGHIPNAKYSICIVHSSINTVIADMMATIELCQDKYPFSKNYRVLKIQEDKIYTNTYCASPFFNDKEIEIRDKMISEFLPNHTFRPDLVNPNIEGDLHKDPELAEKIAMDNFNGIFNANALVFPRYTNDLGTLIEVGYAIACNDKLIISYDENLDSYLIYDSYNVIDSFETNLVLDLSKLGSAIALGYFLATIQDTSSIRYYLNGMKDNVMLFHCTEVKELSDTDVIYPNYKEELLSKKVYKACTMTSAS